MLLKIPGMIAQGARHPSFALIQKHLSQASGSARMPRFFAEIRMGSVVDRVCARDKRESGPEPAPMGTDSDTGAKLFAI